MGFYIVETPTGNHGFQIKADQPDEQEMQWINTTLAGKPPEAQTESEPGLLRSVASGFMNYGNKIQAASDLAVAGIADAVNRPDLSKTWQDYAKAQQAEGATYPVKPGRLGGMAESVGEMIPSLAAMGLAAIAVPETGGASAGALPILASPWVAAATAGTATMAPQMLSDNAARQFEEHGEVKDWRKLVAATGGQTAVEFTNELLLGKIFGFLGKTVPKDIVKKAVDGGINKSLTALVRKYGEPTAFAAVNGGMEEVIQQGMERWQADLPLLDDKAKGEYIESAIAGSILEGAFGGGLGGYNAYQEGKFSRAMEDAKKDVAAEQAAAAGKLDINNLTYEQQRRQPYIDAPKPVIEQPKPEPITDPRLMLPDFSTPSTEQRALEKETSALPKGLREQDDAPVVEEQQGPLFSETDYRRAVDAMRGSGHFSPGHVSMTLQMKKPKAEAIYAEMLRRNDAYPAGSQNQYAQVTVPYGMPTRLGSDVRGTTPETAKPGQTVRARDYIVKPVQPAGAKPFTVKVNGKKRGKTLAFSTREEAEAFVSTIPENVRKNATVEEDTSAYQHGVFEQSYEHMPNREQRLVGERVVNTFSTRGDAEAERDNLDKRYSPETNKANETLTDEQKNERMAQDFRRQTGPLVEMLQKMANGIFGNGRGEIRLAPNIDKGYLASHGIAHDFPDNTVVEGMEQATLPNAQKVMQSLITLNHALTDPNATEEQKAQTLKDVLNHEAIHVLRSLDLLSPQEWHTLLDAAINTKVPNKTYTYIQREIARPGAHQHSVNHLAEEAMAEMTRHYLRDPEAFKGKPHSGMLGKIASFIRRIMGLSRRYPAQDLMDFVFKGGVAARPTGYGGMIPRDSTDVFFSLLKPDNFFLKSLGFIEGIKQGALPPREWWGKLKGGGIKADELNWLGVERWLNDQPQNKPLDKRDLMNFIKGVPGIQVRIHADENDPTIGDEWVNRMQEAEAGQFVPMDDYGPSDLAGLREYTGMQVRGGRDYTEALFLFQPKEGEPTYEHSHWPNAQNMLAHARFTTVVEDGKRWLFIQEMQSDLHQEGSKYGYYNKDTIENLKRIDADQQVLQRQMRDISRRVNDLETQIDNKREAIRKLEREREFFRLNRTGGNGKSYMETVAELDAAIERLDGELEALRVQRPALREEYNQVSAADRVRAKEYNSLHKQRFIPNAPYRTNWEEYVIKRLIRHAAEHEYAGVAWHGELQSLADAENWQGIDVGENEKGSTYTIRNTDAEISPIVNRYFKILPRAVSRLAQPFGADVQMKDASAPSAAAANIAAYTPPPLRTPFEIRNHFSSKRTLSSLISRMHRRQDHELAEPDHTQQREDDQNELISRFERAYQIALNQHDYNPVNALEQAGLLDDYSLTTGEFGSQMIKDALIWTQPNGMWNDVVNSHAPGTAASRGAFPWKNFRLEFNGAMQESFIRGDQPRFSALAPPQYAATAPLGQRVPTNPPLDTLSQIHNRMTYNNIAPWLEKAFGWAGVDYVGTKVFGTSGNVALRTSESTIIALQDKMLSVAKMVDRMKRNNGFITDQNDPFLQATLFPGKVDEEIKRNNLQFVEPLTNAVKALDVNAHDVEQIRNLNPDTQELVHHYIDNKKVDPRMTMAEIGVYALHAKERNLEMKKRNDKIFQASGQRLAQWEAGSGMTDDNADEILDWIGRQRFASQLIGLGPNSVRTKLRALISNTNDVRFRAGLNPDFRNMNYPNGDKVDPYTDYVPLRGFINEAMHPDEQTREFARTGKGFMIRGKEDYTAIGRALPVQGHPGVYEPALAGNLLATAALQNREAVVRAGKNEVDKAFYRLVEQHPTEFGDQAEIMQTPRMKYGYDRKSQSVRLQNANMGLMSDPTVLKLKIDGEQKFVKLHDPQLVKAMNETVSLGQTGLSPLLNGLLKLNRGMAMLRTSLNPDFIFTNFFRDMGGAMVNLGEHQAAGLRRKVAKSIMPAWKGIWNIESGKAPSNQWERDYQEFKAHGGHSAFYGAHELKQTLEQFNKTMAEDYSGAPQKAWKGVKAIFNLIDRTNTAIENGTRLAVYTTLRDHYMSQTANPTDPANIRRAREMAAFAAKNMTVNFNAAGSAKPVLNALYLFFNAGIQGSAALINPFIRSKKIRALWMATIAAGAAQDLLMSMLMPDDDDGKNSYDKIPDYILEKNIVLPNPLLEKGYFKIPLPYLMNSLWNWGRAAARTGRGGYTMGEFLKSGGVTMLDSMNPFGGSNSFLNFVAPSIIDPVVDLYQNEDWTGKPIAPTADPYGPQENASQRYWNNTSPWAIHVADWMSRLTGRQGDYLPGAMEWSPNQIEYVVDFIGGGTLQSIMRGLTLASGGREDPSVGDVPIVRGIMGQVTPRQDLGAYIEGRDRVMSIRQSIKVAAQQGDQNAYTGLMRLYPQEFRASASINKIENARKKISSTINRIKDSQRIPEEQKQAMIERLKAKRDELVASGNKVLQEMRQ